MFNVWQKIAWVPYRKARGREKKWDVRLFSRWVDKSVTHDYIVFMDFGKQLKEMRNSLGISLKTLSSQVEIDRAYLSRVESGKAPPSDGLLEKIAKALGCDKDKLFLLAGRLPDSMLKKVYQNPESAVKRIKTSLQNSVAEPPSPYSVSLMSIGDRAIEDGFPFEYISDIAELESYRKEINRPIYHMHKWWAQRLGSVFRALLLSSAAPRGSNLKEMFYQPARMTGMTVFDPFMGSGTTVGEALKLGCRAIGRDINPVSYFIVKNALSEFSRESVLQTFQSIEKDVSHQIKGYYKGRDKNGNVCDVLYYFWVMTIPCPRCRERVDLFPSYIFSRHAYPKKNPESKSVCPNCGGINSCRFDCSKLKCGHCKHAFDPQKGPAHRVKGTCNHCSYEFPIAGEFKKQEGPPSYRMYAKILLNSGGEKEYASVDSFDEEQYSRASQKLEEMKDHYPVAPIEPGYNTNQVLNYNYRYWHQMFNDRGLLCLGLLSNRIREIKDPAMRSLFACLFSGCLEFNSMFASFKGEGTGAVRHMFSHHILKPERTPLEANLWGTPKSSGSFSTLFQSRVLRALDYREHPFELRTQRVNGKLTGKKVFRIAQPLGSGIAGDFREFENKNMGAYLSCGDSSATDLPDKSVDLVVTDPPFFDNVHYSELADFFYVWLRHIMGSKNIFSGKTTRRPEEVQNAEPGTFSRNLAQVFSECKRVLKDEGLLIFTYHHSRHEGWTSLLDSLAESGFVISAMHPVKSEMSGATPKAQAKEPIDLDIALVCRKRECWQLKELAEPDYIAMAVEAAQKQIVKFNESGRGLGRNDIRVILMGNVLAELSRIRNRDAARDLLREMEPGIEKRIEALHGKQKVKSLKEISAQESFF